ncbi:uncharacterized protein LOC135931710 isoform X2 [Gordionus sp. m RMFG-2023]|uniref:uncharacterized protein LOC135931710 isoform X2 n=1 Tax=Gordionus sp. m RMFG-2023 TaxID=3053472 RepID=UPI0031FC45E0
MYTAPLSFLKYHNKNAHKIGGLGLPNTGIGGRENYYHDYVCGMCYQKGTVHKCIENIGRSPCPVCLEDLHTSTIPCIVNKCGHILHQTCLRILKTNSDNNCPLCRTPMITDEDLEKLTSAQLVLETRVEILCYNCGHTFHTLANENGYTCLDCHSTHTGLIT